MGRAIVTVAVGKRADVGKLFESHLIGQNYADKVERWSQSYTQYDANSQQIVFRTLPAGSPEHHENPYAFKAYAIEAALNRGFTSILWADISVIAVRTLQSMWELTENNGYWFADNRNWNCGQWASDASLPLLGISREQAFGIPQITATAFALNFSWPIAGDFFARFMNLARNGAFRGSWVNARGEASADRRVLGHRHDQTAASVVAYQLGMQTTQQPFLFSDGRGVTEETVLQVFR